MEENEERSEQEAEEGNAHKRRIRYEAERMGETMFSRDTRDHLIRASAEMMLAIDSMIPRGRIPEDVKKHYLAAKRETLLLVRSVIDSQIGIVRDIETEKEPPQTGLRKIELE